MSNTMFTPPKCGAAMSTLVALLLFLRGLRGRRRWKRQDVLESCGSVVLLGLFGLHLESESHTTLSNPSGGMLPIGGSE